MACDDIRQDDTLPVTAEVGSEGGSYADSRLQVATLGDERAAGGADRSGSAAAASPVSSSESAGGYAGPTPGMKRYPTESPGKPRRRGRAPRWAAGALGLAAGAAGALLVTGVLRRKGRP